MSGRSLGAVSTKYTRKQQFYSVDNVANNTEQMAQKKAPKYPQYSERKNRAASYYGQNTVVEEEKAVEAGLFHTGDGDTLRCYQCGVPLRNWTRGDDAMKEHASHSPTCQYVWLKMGDEYVNRTCRTVEKISNEDWREKYDLLKCERNRLMVDNANLHKQVEQQKKQNDRQLIELEDLRKKIEQQEQESDRLLVDFHLQMEKKNQEIEQLNYQIAILSIEESAAQSQEATEQIHSQSTDKSTNKNSNSKMVTSVMQNSPNQQAKEPIFPRRKLPVITNRSRAWSEGAGGGTDQLDNPQRPRSADLTFPKDKVKGRSMGRRLEDAKGGNGKQDVAETKTEADLTFPKEKVTQRSVDHRLEGAVGGMLKQDEAETKTETEPEADLTFPKVKVTRSYCKLSTEIERTKDVARSSCIEMGYTEQQVDRAVRKVEKKGITVYRAADLLQILMEMEESGEDYLRQQDNASVNDDDDDDDEKMNFKSLISEPSS